MKIVVGSTNPVKIAASEVVFQKMLAEDVQAVGVDVCSGVSDQPMNIEESYQGALQRVENVLDQGKFAYAVGIEGGVHKFSFGWFTLGVVVILDREGNKGVGLSPALPMTERTIQKLQAGEELGEVVEKESGIENVKQKQGAFGLYTKGFVTRQQGYEDGIAFALSQFLNHEKF